MTSDPINPGKAMTLPPRGVGVGMTDDGNSTSAVIGLGAKAASAEKASGHYMRHAAHSGQGGAYSGRYMDTWTTGVHS